MKQAINPTVIVAKTDEIVIAAGKEGESIVAAKTINSHRQIYIAMYIVS